MRVMGKLRNSLGDRHGSFEASHDGPEDCIPRAAIPSERAATATDDRKPNMMLHVSDDLLLDHLRICAGACRHVDMTCRSLGPLGSLSCCCWHHPIMVRTCGIPYGCYRPLRRPVAPLAGPGRNPAPPFPLHLPAKLYYFYYYNYRWMGQIFFLPLHCGPGIPIPPA